MFLAPKQVHLHYGLEKPVKILQLTDVHVGYGDPEDSVGRKRNMGGCRYGFFKEGKYPPRSPSGFLKEAMEYSKDFDFTVITGDLLNYFSRSNLEICHNILSGHDYMYCSGNHEFLAELWMPCHEDRSEFLAQVQSYFRGDMFFDSRIVGGVNVVAMDNAYCVYTEEQFEKLKFEVSRGLPILLFSHTPLSDGGLRKCPNPVTEEDILTTGKVLDYIAQEPLIKDIFTGHYHGDSFRGYPWVNGKTLYILGGLFNGTVGEIIID